MNQTSETSTSIVYQDIKTDIEAWIKHAICLENYENLETLWPVLVEAGLTNIGKPADYCRVLLMAIGLVDLQRHLLSATSGHWLTDYDNYHCLERT